MATFGKQTAVRVSARELACNSQTNTFMKKELTLGTPSVPVLRVSAERFRELLNRVLPEECQVKTASDGWYVVAIFATVATLLFPPLVAVVGYCVYRAEKAKKGGER